jgi:hypothetical protein
MMVSGAVVQRCYCRADSQQSLNMHIGADPRNLRIRRQFVPEISPRVTEEMLNALPHGGD